MSEVGGLTFAPDPEALGFDPEGLRQLDAWMAGMVDAGHVAGTSTLLMRHGQVVAFNTFGRARLDSGEPLARDAIVRIYSMTKPVTGVAMMTLFEEGRWRLDDLITKFIPEFADLKVFAGLDADGAMMVEDAVRPPTMRELMSHTAGFAYGLFDHHPVERAYRGQGVMTSSSLEQLVERVARIPLMFQPGTEWFYSLACELQGLIVERLSGLSLGAFFEQRIFKPLAMVDTGFHTRPDNAHRLAAMYRGGADGSLQEADEAFAMPINDYTRPPRFEAGGGGLVSTATDYARFCQMILNRGELNGVRILSPDSVALMSTNVIPDEVLAVSNPLRLLPFNPAFGFGLDLAIVLDPRAMGLVEGKGTLSWGGGGGTWFWIDPENDIVFVGLIQRMADPVSNEFRGKARTLVYQALTHPEK